MRDEFVMLSKMRFHSSSNSEGEGEVAFFSAKRWDRRNRADLIDSVTLCHDARVVGPYRDSIPLRLTVLAAMSEDYTTAPQPFLKLDNRNPQLIEMEFLNKCLPYGSSKIQEH